LTATGRGNIAKHVCNLVLALNEKEKNEVLNVLQGEGIPISAFRANLSGLEIIVRYLKETKKKPFKEISGILNRKPSTIYGTYYKSRKKFKGSLDISDISIKIPYDIFSDRKYSVLELIVAYLEGEKGISKTQISLLLHKSINTIKTVHRRFKVKNE